MKKLCGNQGRKPLWNFSTEEDSTLDLPSLTLSEFSYLNHCRCKIQLFKKDFVVQ